jgi:hypothetical protein
MTRAIALILALGLAAPATGHEAAPAPIASWLSSLPQENVGQFYAKIKDPFGNIFIGHVEAWGQLCDGSDQYDMVADYFYNILPLHGFGFKYIAWRCAYSDGKKPITGTVPPADRHPRISK